MKHGGRKLVAILLATLWLTVAWARSPGQQALDDGVVHYRQGEFREALLSFRRAIDLDPSLIKAWENMGWAQHRLGDDREALRIWNTILKLEPDNVAAWNAVGDVQLEREAWGEAAAALTRSLALDADQPDVRLRLGRAQEALGRLDAAAAQYRTILERRPGDTKASVRLADLEEGRGRLDAAATVLRAALARGSDPDRVLTRRLARVLGRSGDAAFEEERWQAAAESYRQAERLDPERGVYVANLGWAQRKAGDLDGAVATWKRALAARPANAAELWRAVGDAERDAGRPADARQAYARAVESDPGSRSALYAMAVLSFESGRAHDAVAALERSVEAPGATVDDAIRAADLCIREGAIEAGETMFSQLAESALHASAAKIALARLRAAQGGAAYRAGDDRAAIAAYERALDADPRNVAASRDYGWALWRTGDWKGVRRVWTAYAAAYPERPEPYELLGRLELHEGQPLRAIEQAQKALAAGGDTLGPNMLMTRAFLANAQYQRARRLAEEVASAHPGDLVAQTLYAEALWRTLDFRASAGQWRKVMDMGFDTPRATHYWLRSLYETGDADGAIAAAEKVFDSGKASEPVIRLLAEDALVRGDDAATIRWYGELTQRYPQRAAYWIALVDAYRQAGRRRDEGRAVKEALKLHPETTELLVADAEFQLVKRRPAKALERYRALTDRYGPTYATFDGELRALRAAGREDEALILLRAEGPAYLDADDLALSEASILEALGRRGEADAVRGRVVSRRGGAVELPILLYHGIADHPRTLNVPLDRFERQMRAVRDAGYTPITIAELDAMLAGRASFPGRPIAVTFDDARGDSFRYGDPILARLGMKATMFVPTVRVADESAFNADWATLKRLAGTGRWDFQAHGHLAHDPIAVDGEGGLAEFLVNRAWLPEQERMETHEEFAARVERDYDICRARLLENLPGQAVVGYAFPFSEMGQLHGGNDAKALAVNESAFGKRYRYGFLQDSSGYNTLTPGRRGPVILRRLNVPRDWDAERLMAHLASESPAQRARLAGAEAALANAEYAEAERALRGMIAENPRSYPTAGLVLARDLQEQGRVREAERAYRLVPSGPGWDRPDAERRELARDLAWETDPQAGAEVRVVSDSDERDVFQALATARYPLEAPVDFWGSAGSVQFRDAVFDTLAGFQGTLGMAWIGASRTTAGGWLRGRSLGSGVQTVSGQASVRAGLDRHRFGAACGVTDVETVGALMDAVQSRGCDGAYDVTGRRWRARTRIAYGDLTDGNAILYGWADGTVALPWMRDLSVGGRLEAGDSRTASPLYYAPAGLITAIGLVRYARAFPGGARLEAEGGIGPSRDERVSSRMVGRARVAWTQDWGLSWRSTVVGEYGETADYRRTTLSLAFGYRF